MRLNLLLDVGHEQKEIMEPPCRCPAIRGKTRCRIHGGAKGSGAPRCNANALKHGGTTAKVKAFRIEIRGIIQHSKKLINEFSQ